MEQVKLTPRVGDRVLTPGLLGRTHIGDVQRAPTPEDPDVFIVRVDGESKLWRRLAEELTVVDREPVEWPEGWKRWGDATARWVGPANHLFICRKGALAELLATGPEMLARWDELMGEQ